MDGAAVGDGSSIGLQAICLTNGEYTIELVEGLWSLEVLWSISCTGGETISGGSPSVTNFSITDQECVVGCTNPEADNYNEFWHNLISGKNSISEIEDYFQDKYLILFYFL